MQQTNYKHLCEAERDITQVQHQEGVSQRVIAEEIGRNQGTISRELKRNQGKYGYRAISAQRKAAKRKEGKEAQGRMITPELRSVIGQQLERVGVPNKSAGDSGLKRAKGRDDRTSMR